MRWDGKRLAAARQESGLSQGALARLVGVTQPVIRRWEEGLTEPRGKHLVRLAQVLGRPEAYFYGVDEPGGEAATETKELHVGEGRPIPAAAMPEPTTPDWDAPPATGPAPTLEDILRRVDEQERRIRELEGRLGPGA